MTPQDEVMLERLNDERERARIDRQLTLQLEQDEHATETISKGIQAALGYYPKAGSAFWFLIGYLRNTYPGIKVPEREDNFLDEF